MQYSAFLSAMNLACSFSFSASNRSSDKTVDEHYISMSGTSMATPMVSAAAALLYQYNPYFSPKDIKKIFVKKQSGETLFSFRIRGLSQSEIQAAAKKATKQIPNPAGPKYPKISGERSTTEYHNNLIYTATVDEDKQRIWGNNDIKQKFNIFDDADCVDILLNAGTKSKIVDEVLKLSGFDGEDIVDEEDYIKN